MVSINMKSARIIHKASSPAYVIEAIGRAVTFRLFGSKPSQSQLYMITHIGATFALPLVRMQEGLRHQRVYHRTICAKIVMPLP